MWKKPGETGVSRANMAIRRHRFATAQPAYFMPAYFMPAGQARSGRRVSQMLTLPSSAIWSASRACSAGTRIAFCTT
jgi:hypothetical protein